MADRKTAVVKIAAVRWADGDSFFDADHGETVELPAAEFDRLAALDAVEASGKPKAESAAGGGKPKPEPKPKAKAKSAAGKGKGKGKPKAESAAGGPDASGE